MKAGDPRPRPRRIGLFGGSFDPVHAGHLHAARAAARAFELDRVIFVPAAESPHKVGVRLASGADRARMIELAIQDEPAFSVSRLELERGGRSYTIDTARDLPRAVGEPEDCEIYLVIGSDNVALLATWREADRLLERVQPVVVHRAGEPALLLAGVERRFGRAVVDKLRRGYLELPPVPVSATDVRARLARPGAGSAADLALDPRVLDYVRAHGLYGARAGGA